ncbi:MAG TPA: bile acid:sodium symporter family protein [Chryseolinea sp.]|nr:bile acid:sodium symporter family protein [Chryseolinea sp.]HPM29269.1 bile acid:sodium symporter family protein [Chryseolinea sp.]
METEAITINFSEGSLTVLNICLALIMFGVALSIKLEHFRQLRNDRKALLTGLFSQYILLPVITVILIYVLSPSNEIALGMILVAACPGGNASNFFSMLAKGNVALSVTLTAITSVSCFLVTPLSFFFWSSLVPGLSQSVQSFEINFLDLFLNMIMILLLPLIGGMTFGHYYPKITQKIEKIFRALSIIILMSFIGVAFMNNFSVFKDHIFSVFWLVLLHNGLALMMAYYFSKLLKNKETTNRSVAIETAIQNSGLGLVLIFTFFQGNGSMALVAAWWGIWHLVSGFTFAYFIQRKGIVQPL